MKLIFIHNFYDEKIFASYSQFVLKNEYFLKFLAIFKNDAILLDKKFGGGKID